MPKSWSNKRERQYEHIKEGYEKRGTRQDRAEEIAARTVNKERSERGETRRQRASASQSGERTRDELYQEARRRSIPGRSSMSKEQLKKAIGR